ncbi:dynein light chain tctex-type 1 [Lynx pardinus]|uniref:Dynein light chain tctex-type 1 n=1 Tax=Lynx pardinus TaxID=191816 RepID=A0A485PMK6_LYNPA|nr:dynein light chain tctex-type 1 [Lynx pardinus]
MEDYQAAEETAFVVDEVSNIVKEAIESAIGGNAYQHSKVNQWTTNVVEQTLSQLTKLGKPFKYIGNAFLLLIYTVGGSSHIYSSYILMRGTCSSVVFDLKVPSSSWSRCRVHYHPPGWNSCRAHGTGFPSIADQLL